MGEFLVAAAAADIHPANDSPTGSGAKAGIAGAPSTAIPVGT
jgi:hypothetical protein